MTEPFADILTVGGKSNSLGRANEVIELVLHDKTRLEELYSCLFDDGAWIRMRAADAIEKVCRVHPDWLEPYVDRFSDELASSTQPSIQWHLAEIYMQVKLSDKQRKFAIYWLKDLISTKEVDWIVSANAMKALTHFVEKGYVSVEELVPLLKIQGKHKSNAVRKRADKLLATMST